MRQGAVSMYGLPEDVDLSFLIRASLTQVCVGENEVILNFEPDISIMSASSVTVELSADDKQTYESARDFGRRAIEFIGDIIGQASAVPGGTTRILWTSGRVIELLDTWPQYESYTIRHGESLIVV
jgi:hypothetical protein